MTREHTDQFEYDVALSFAEADRAVAEQLAGMLRTENMNVLLDLYREGEASKSDFVAHIAELYRTKARYYVMLISRHYPLKRWTEAERTSAQEHALRDANEYILPVQLDDTELPGIRETTGYRDLREHSMESIVHLLVTKLAETKSRSGPPTRSHDLRSGNIPSTDQNP